jgi:hypothetical protein
MGDCEDARARRIDAELDRRGLEAGGEGEEGEGSESTVDDRHDGS